jgi:hypothetical protein
LALTCILPSASDNSVGNPDVRISQLDASPATLFNRRLQGYARPPADSLPVRLKAVL